VGGCTATSQIAAATLNASKGGLQRVGRDPALISSFGSRHSFRSARPTNRQFVGCSEHSCPPHTLPDGLGRNGPNTAAESLTAVLAGRNTVCCILNVERCRYGAQTLLIGVRISIQQELIEVRLAQLVGSSLWMIKNS
jgi:hypothetical protein